MRLTPFGLSTALVLSLTVTACSSSAPTQANCEPVLSGGSLTASIDVSGSFGEAPSVTLPSDTSSVTSQRAVVLTEDKPDAQQLVAAQPGDLVSINFTIINGSTGEEIESSEFSPTTASAPVILAPEFSFPALSDGLVCAQPGERLLITAAPADGLGPEASANWGLDEDTTLVIVADVIAVGPTRSVGEVRQLPNGFPNVVTTNNGRVGIVLPPSNPPADVRVAQRIAGSGAVVRAEDTVFAQVLSVVWDTRQILSNTWEQGQPTSLGAEVDGLPVRAELTGYRVGSQIVTITPGQSGPEVSVIDILGVG